MQFYFDCIFIGSVWSFLKISHTPMEWTNRMLSVMSINDYILAELFADLKYQINRNELLNRFFFSHDLYEYRTHFLNYNQGDVIYYVFYSLFFVSQFKTISFFFSKWHFVYKHKKNFFLPIKLICYTFCSNYNKYNLKIFHLSSGNRLYVFLFVFLMFFFWLIKSIIY